MIKELNGIDEEAFKIGELVEHDGPERKVETELYRTNYGYEKKITVTSYEIAEDVLSANYRYGEENNKTKFYALNKDDALNIAVEQDFKFNVPFSEVFNRNEFIDAQYEHHMGKIPSFNINGEIVSAKTLPFDELDTLNGLNKVEIYLLPLVELEQLVKENHIQKKFNQINNLNKTTMENQKVTGFMGKDFYYSDKGKTPVASFQLGETKNGVTTWTNVKAFGETAIQIKAAKENGIKKYQVEGPLKDDKPYTKADGSTVTPKALTVQSLQYYQLQELSGVIAKAENKETKAGKEYIALYVKNKVDKGGVQQTMDYNIKIYPPVSAPKRTNPDGTEWKLESGQPVAIKGEVATSFYIKDNELKTGQNITAWNVDRTLTLLQGQIKEKQETQGLSL